MAPRQSLSGFTTEEQRFIDASYRTGYGDAHHTFEQRSVPSIKQIKADAAYMVDEYLAEGLSEEAAQAAHEEWAKGYRAGAEEVQAAWEKEYGGDELDGIGRRRGFLG